MYNYHYRLLKLLHRQICIDSENEKKAALNIQNNNSSLKFSVQNIKRDGKKKKILKFLFK